MKIIVEHKEWLIGISVTDKISIWDLFSGCKLE